MKIKELTIKNIASIEEAHIDFEKGLLDGVTGDPASIFLICGDTGAGKSVILDAISMALYKNTPRLEGVATKKKNDYSNNEGETINIFSIEQYTRLGIGPTDECYSEVVFEGNDKKEYHAKLKLGMMLSRAGTDGTPHLKHRNPIWSVKVEKEDYVTDNCAAIIYHAIGLDFDQFCRMAMLAQGQFAEFLTGSKDKREVILEKLTNTQIFSKYGETIHTLYSNHKKTKENAETIYQTESTHTLEQSVLDELNTNLNDFNVQKRTLDQQNSEINQKLSTVSTILAKKEERDKIEGDRVETQTKIKGDEYQQKKALIADWDASDAARTAIKNLSTAKKSMIEAESKLKDIRTEFHCLSADIEYRKEQTALLDNKLKAIDNELLKQHERDELYSKAHAYDSQLEHYQFLKDNIAEQQEKLSLKQGQTGTLTDIATQQQELVKQAQDDVDKKQKNIDEITAERNLLNPNEINKKINTINLKKGKFNELQNDLKALSDDKSKALAQEKEIKEEEKTLTEYQKTLNDAQNELQSATDKYDKAQNRLLTMEMSVDKKIIEVRQRLYHEKTETCPLCGQHIDHLSFEADFQEMLSPLQQEEKEAEMAKNAASQKREDAKGKYDRCAGSLNTKSSHFNSLKISISEKEEKIKRTAISLGLDINTSLERQVDDAIDSMEKECESLITSQKNAEKLQNTINTLLEEKKPLDQRLSDANTAKTKADNNLNDNKKEIENIQDTIQTRTNERDQLIKTLSAMLDGFYPLWRTETNAVREGLIKDAKEYNDKKTERSTLWTDIEKYQNTLNSIQGIQSNILRDHPDWDNTYTSTRYESKEDIIMVWNHLSSSDKQELATLTKSKEDIDRENAILTPYYSQTGKDEESLWKLIGQEVNVKEARSYVNNLDATLISHNDAINKASEAIAEGLGKLNLVRYEDLPNKADLEQQQQALSAKIEDLVGEIGAINEKIKDNNTNVEKLNEARKAFEKANEEYEKWKKFDEIFGGTRFRTLVQSYILLPLLNNANIYLSRITDRYELTCSAKNEQLSILILDKYNKNQVRSVTVLSGGERFMVSLALSLALSSLNRPDLNVNILFIDEGFGTLDEKSLDSVMATLEKLQDIACESKRRVGIISHREELEDRIQVKIQVRKKGEGRSRVEISNTTI